jgi:isocitrate dehydrogenase (NAD+)
MHEITLIPGDGIGPSIVESARAVVEACGVAVSWDEQPAGEAALKQKGDPLPEATLDSIRRNRVALKGPCATPTGKGFRSVNVAMRKEFDLFANVRPARSLAGVPSRFQNVDLVTVRENTEGLYSSMEHWIGSGHHTAAMGIGVNTRPNMVRLCRFAFDYARREGRRKVTAVHKANILKILSGLFLEVAREVARDYPEIEFEERIVDAMAMHLVMRPEDFDVLVSTNLFGDIISDLAAGLVGGLGVAPGANIGEEVAIFEAIHGTAPDIAGQDLANPTSILLAAAMMLRHLGEDEAGGRIEQAVFAVLEDGRRVTRDLNPHGVGTREMTEAVVEAL